MLLRQMDWKGQMETFARLIEAFQDDNRDALLELKENVEIIHAHQSKPSSQAMKADCANGSVQSSLARLEDYLR